MRKPTPVSAHIHPMMSLIGTTPLSFLLASRHAAVEAFLKTAKEEGLVTAPEYIRLRSALASEM